MTDERNDAAAHQGDPWSGIPAWAARPAPPRHQPPSRPAESSGPPPAPPPIEQGPAPLPAAPPAAGWAALPEPSGPVAQAGRGAGGRRGGLRSAIAGGVAGALVASLVTGGLFVAFDDDGDGGSRNTNQAAAIAGEALPARASTVLAAPGDIRAILDRVQPAVVRINVGGRQGNGAGSGFIVGSDGVIVTNAHVVAGAEDITVILDGGDELPAEILGIDEYDDLAVVKIDRTNLPTVELGNSDALQVGDAVVAIGTALGLEGGPSVTSGIVSALERSIATEADTLLPEHDPDRRRDQPGQLGGPLVDSDGRVVGINTAIANPAASNNVGFAIAISSATSIIEDLGAGRDAQIAFLGVATRTLTADEAATRDLGVEHGALVVETTDGAPAAEAGIEVGDVIVEIGGREIRSMENVAREVRRHDPDDEVEVVVVRDSGSRSFTVVLAERPTQM
ncbi:MAG: S1C family serine protease [Acidimicrobiia bacterium]|nr:S1C family serine protease [Acidimicrobiia bacterium]